MSNNKTPDDQKPNQQLNLIPTYIDDGLTDVVSDNASVIRGRIMKFVDSRYMAGDEHVPEGTRVAVAGAVTCWRHWDDGHVVETIIKQPGVAFPLRSELSDKDETQWPAGPGGTPSDPWQLTFLLYLPTRTPAPRIRSPPRPLAGGWRSTT